MIPSKIAVADGSIRLNWAVRQSFLNYVERLPDGSIRAEDGARRTRSGFVLCGRREGENRFEFDGTLRFSGYSGILNVEMRNLCVEWSVDGGELSAAVARSRYTLVRFTDFNSDLDEILHSEDVSLTDDGAAILGDVYAPGAPAAPIRISSAP
ncbi:MAG: HtaA domain-containing protein [Gulosibacter sp.]|uniref:HtaA domain-containing protein n=1 Tax=Gulosibacter sp. TaxID=2817531 RepID=UPI003F9192C0